ncbi:hypothetical protein OG520_39230 [Streptomyces sp. NBC_00984]|uniref:hypothetical protein n=1 Tax=Streptomyces sp. NBC_00984 TaxID=2903700 RepID=UPI003869FA8D|nr:hypothetical protein OG520_39230 [Streptomyces sp. NBC_00984]
MASASLTRLWNVNTFRRLSSAAAVTRPVCNAASRAPRAASDPSPASWRSWWNSGSLMSTHTT